MCFQEEGKRKALQLREQAREQAKLSKMGLGGAPTGMGGGMSGMGGGGSVSDVYVYHTATVVARLHSLYKQSQTHARTKSAPLLLP